MEVVKVAVFPPNWAISFEAPREKSRVAVFIVTRVYGARINTTAAATRKELLIHF